MEILGSSRDLQSLTIRMPLDVANQLTQEYFSTKIVRPSLTGSRESPAYTATFKQDKGSHLLLLYLLRFKPHVKGDSETALPKLVVPIVV
jgi:hypothetical protein